MTHACRARVICIWSIQSLDSKVLGPIQGANGHYMLRAYPENTHSSLKATKPRIFLIETTVVVEDEFGARQDIDVGVVSPVEVSGRVLGADGNGVKDAIVRFTSLRN